MNNYVVGVVDDHVLFAQSLQGLINSFDGFEVAFMARNGNDLIGKMSQTSKEPDIILLDINMPVMNGFETLNWLNENHPNIKTITLSMDDEEETIINMLKAGSKGYLLKDIHPDTLHLALNEVISKGHFYTDNVTTALLKGVSRKDEDELQDNFSQRELEFMALACSDKTYKQIASEMCLSPKTIDNYRDTLFRKLEVRSRIGLVLYALKNKIVSN
ncbi:response regulator [Leeuwenhoekiella polynyae]|uniref:LuxR family two component transcriptional regulator n=1 Tax=Leeuwenhoekiella polynyae TaxID=1550906 RepID=A0A4V1KQQ6_9FLAO|nr:response regulator transcription factor [Leeuwenhoekiella polynyae]RXG22242.1 LuxR family two component transcriptional regulator [Leeuwenhoekiella polynyae]